MPDFSRIISMAYLRILERLPDPGGLAAYNDAMNGGLTEALMRESLLRSQEYADRHPSAPASAAGARITRAAASPSGASRKKAAGRARRAR
jgi:hypothetical protein